MYKKSFYSVVLTSMVCVLGVMSGTFASVRNLGTSGSSSDTKTSSVSNTGASASSGQSLRASSLRFSPGTISTSGTTATKTSDDGNSGTKSAVVTDSNAASARLSIGKYLNLSHSNKPTQNQGGNTVVVNPGDDWTIQIDRVSSRVDAIDLQKQNKLIVKEGDYINIEGPDENIISIDAQALQNDIQQAVGTDKDILTELDSNYKLWWCYANDAKTECVGERQEVIDLGTLLRDYNLVEKNISLKEALAGKQGTLTEAENGYIEVNQDKGTVGVRFAQLRNALGISDAKQSEIQYTSDGKLQWRYMDEYESDGTTKRWHTADIQALIDSSLANYVTSEAFNNYVLNAEHGDLAADPNGYLEIDSNNQIGVKFDDLKTALQIPEERAVEIDFSNDGKIKWRYVGDTNWNQTNSKISDFVDLSNYVLKSELGDLQGQLTVMDNGYLQINGNNQIGIKFTDLKNALQIPAAQQDIEMQITSNGQFQWRYLNEFESDGTTKKWTTVSMSIGDLIENKLIGYQRTLTTNESGYLEIDGNAINLKFDELKTALQIPAAQQDIEMQITSNGQFQWRYLNEFESDGTTKKWTTVSMSIGDLIENKLVGYQRTLTTNESGYLEIDGNAINLKFAELKTALQIPAAQQDIEMEITSNGNLRWRYLNEFESDGTTKKWTTVSMSIGDLIENKLDGYQRTLTTDNDGYLSIDGNAINLKFVELKRALGIPEGQQDIEMEITDAGILRWRYFNQFESDGTTKAWTTVSMSIGDLIDNKLNGYQRTLSTDGNGYLSIEGDAINLKFTELKNALNIPDAQQDIEMQITSDGNLQWRYANQFESDGKTKAWTTVSMSISDLIDNKLNGYQRSLSTSEDGYLSIEGDAINLKFTELKRALNIPAAQQDIEMEITDGGVLRWRYANQFEQDGTTKSWTNVSNSINDLIDNKLLVLNNYQKTLSADQNGFLLIDNDVISIKFAELKAALGIPDAEEKIEMEITDAGVLRWRYLNEFEADGTTKKWTTVSASIGDLIDGKLADFATKQYVDTGLDKKQVKLTEAENGFINVTTEGVIGVRFDELKTALGIVNHRPLEMQVDNGVLKWRYTDTTGEPEWTTVYDLKLLLDDYVKTSDLNLIVNRIDNDLAGKQIKLTATPGGFIVLTETGEISVDFESLRNRLALDGDDARTSELRVKGGELQWRYLDEVSKDDEGNLTEIWHTLDLSSIELPYVTRSYLLNNYYNKTYIDNTFYNKTTINSNYYNKTDVDSLAESIENNINIRLERWALDKDGPTDNGLFLLSVADGDNDNKVSTWRPVQIAGAEDAE